MEKQEIEITVEMRVQRTFKVRVTPDEMESVREDAWIPNLGEFQNMMAHDTEYSAENAEWDWEVAKRHEDGVCETIIEFNRD